MNWQIFLIFLVGLVLGIILDRVYQKETAGAFSTKKGYQPMSVGEPLDMDSPPTDMTGIIPAPRTEIRVVVVDDNAPPAGE